MSDRQTFLKEKPYAFVPLLKQCKRRSYSAHNQGEKDTYSGKLNLKITVVTPLHIGGKQQDYDENGNVIKRQMRRNKKMIIPGSSLKGVIRSIAEAVSYSCAVKVPDLMLEKILPANNNQSCFNIKDGLCITCSIFGMMSKSESYKGKVNFGEFVLENNKSIYKKIPLLETPFKNYPTPHDVFSVSQKTDNYGNERLYYCKACKTGNCQECGKEEFFRSIEAAGKEREMEFRGRKFYGVSLDKENQTKEKGTCYEMIEPESVLRGEILFQNLREEEGRLLAYALGIGGYFPIRLGYGKPLGYGKVKVELESVESMEGRYFLGKEITKDMVEGWGESYRIDNSTEIKEIITTFEGIMNREWRKCDAKRSDTTNSY